MPAAYQMATTTDRTPRMYLNDRLDELADNGELKMVAVAVGRAIARYLGKDENGRYMNHVFASRETLARRMGGSVKSVTRGTTALEAAGVIAVTHRANKTNHYVVLAADQPNREGLTDPKEDIGEGLSVPMGRPESPAGKASESRESENLTRDFDTELASRPSPVENFTEPETSNAADRVTVELPPASAEDVELVRAEIRRRESNGYHVENQPGLERVMLADEQLMATLRRKAATPKRKYPGWMVGYLLDATTHPDGEMDFRWRDRYEYGPHADKPPHVQAANSAKHTLRRMHADGEPITEQLVIEVLDAFYEPVTA